MKVFEKRDKMNKKNELMKKIKKDIVLVSIIVAIIGCGFFTLIAKNIEKNSIETSKTEKNETILSDGTVLSNLNQLSSGLLRNHEEYSKGSKLTLKFKNIPILDFCKIKKN